MSQTIQTPEQKFNLAKLLGYDYEFQSETGASNVVADSFLRINPVTSGQCFILYVPNFVFMDKLKQTLLSCSAFQSQLESDQLKPLDYPNYRIYGDLLFFKDAIWIDSGNPFMPLLIEFHATPIGGHLKVKKTLHRLRSSFYWSTIVNDVKVFICQCKVCQQFKPVTRKPVGLLPPILIPTNIWEDLSLDFVTHLPCSNGFTFIFVVVDRFSKGVHLRALPMQFTTFKVVTLFLNTVCKLHGFLRSIISDCNPIFTSPFWRELFKLSDTTLCTSIAYHPQSDGQTEVMNRIIEQYL